GKELHVFGVFIRRRRHRDNDEPSRHAYGLSSQLHGIDLVLEHLQYRHDVECAVSAGKILRIGRENPEPFDTTPLHSLKIGTVLGIWLDSDDREFWESIKQRPKKDAAPRPNVEEGAWRDSAQNTKHRTHARQFDGTLEAMQLQAGIPTKLKQLLSVQVRCG